MKLYSKFISYLYEKLPKNREEISRSEILKDYYNKKYPCEPIFYNGRTLPGSQKRFKVDVRNFFTLNDETLKNIIKSLRITPMDDNQKALTCLRYIIENIPYKTDTSNYSLGEFWCMPYETLEKGVGDCEDTGILLANLLMLSGIPNWKIRVNAGYVFEPISKKQCGHAYVTFFDEENEKWVILDTCFHQNLKKIVDREEYKKNKMYQDVWFSFNSTHAFAGRIEDIKNMEGF